MNHGAKVLMVWLQGVLSTTSRGHASQSGSFILSLCIHNSSYWCFISKVANLIWYIDLLQEDCC